MGRKRKAIFLIAFLATGFSQNTNAWEADVHYLLTKWLALRAGFSEEDSRTIAKGDLDVDSTALEAIGHVIFGACLGRDAVRSRLVRDLHFPSWASVPSVPEKRLVAPGSNASHYALNSLINTPFEEWNEIRKKENGPLRNEFLYKVGMGLHALQDSWAHQGFPDISVFCSNELAWGHPKINSCDTYAIKNPSGCGGYDNHSADLTHERTKAMVEDMMKASYEHLSSLLTMLYEVPPKSFPGVPDKFTQADTKIGKLDWLKKQPSQWFSDDERTLVCSLNVRDGALNFSPLCKERFGRGAILGRSNFLRRVGLSSCEAVPDTVKNQMLMFFSRWAISPLKDAHLTYENYVSITIPSTKKEIEWKKEKDLFLEKITLQSAGAKWWVEEKKSQNPILRYDIQTLHFLQWRRRDHGSLAQREHELPDWKNQSEFVTDEENFRPYKTLEEAFLAEDENCTSPIGFTRDQSSPDTYIARARWRHAPEDLILLKVRLGDDQKIYIEDFKSVVIHGGHIREDFF